MRNAASSKLRGRDDRKRTRRAVVRRDTRETRIAVELRLDGAGRHEIQTGIRFLDHMLELFSLHGGFDLTMKVDGDLDVDQHHSVEDAGIALGSAFAEALGDRRGIARAGWFVMPMDETLALAAVDFSGRAHAIVEPRLRARLVGDLQAELLHDFYMGFASGARCNVHVRTLYGRSSHHKVEAIFKAFARSVRAAVARDQRMKSVLPSTKGLIEGAVGRVKS
jgi:imidazoleglycerol-phosphate dehydratase